MAKKGAWFRVAAAVPGDQQVGELADLLAVPISQAVGLLVCTWAGLALYQEDGNITDINDNQLERWAYWTGEPGLFASTFRFLFSDSSGQVKAWTEYQGPLIDYREKEKARVRDYREKKRQAAQNGKAVETKELPKTKRTRTERVAYSPTVQDSTVQKSTTSEPSVAGDKKPVKTTWLTPYYNAYRAKRGEKAVVPVGVMSKILKKLHDKHGEKETLTEIEAYLDRTPVQYESWPKFGSGFGSWASAPLSIMSKEEEALWNTYKKSTEGK